MLLELEGDPLFEVGDRVGLALRLEPQTGSYVLVGPQGRFSVQADGTVRPILEHDSVVAPLAGLSIDALLDQVAQASES